MSLHTLLLLSDSALPLGTFAFSSGLESHLAHAKLASHAPDLKAFLRSSITNTATTQLPFALSTFRDPSLLAEADDVLDASTPCAVARRASVAQGRALASLWTRALRIPGAAGEAIDTFVARAGASSTHLAPLWGAVCAALGLAEREAMYVFLLGQAKGVVSAGVRSGTLGPYAGQALLGSGEVRAWVEGAVEEEIAHFGGLERAGVAVPAVDLWMGRHELLYSRIFNS